jgi:DNA gyrase/topoisomerase IV subunit A
MFQKKDVQWWISEVQQHPETAADLVRMLGDRIDFLDRQNEELRAELITLKRNSRGGDTESLKRRIAELESAMRGGSERRVVIYGRDTIYYNNTLSVALQVGLPNLDRTLSPSILICDPGAKLVAIGEDSRVYAMSYADLPMPTDQPMALERPNNIAIILDSQVFERNRYLSVVTRGGLVYSELGGALMAVGRKGEKLLRNLRPDDAILTAAPSSNADLFAISGQGRWIRFSEKILTSAGTPIMKLPGNDQVVSVVPLVNDANIVFITAQGKVYVRASGRDLAARKTPGSGGSVLFKGDTILGARAEDEHFCLTASGKLLHVLTSDIPFRAQTESGYVLPGFAPGDAIVALG